MKKKIWFAYCHRCIWENVDEKEYFLSHLGKIGKKCDQIKSDNAPAYPFSL